MTMRSLLIGCALLSALSLGACDHIVYSGPTAITTKRAELYQDQFSTEAVTGTLTANQITTLTRDYWGNGDGPLTLAVTYDPHSKTNTALKAANASARLVAALKQKGVQQIQSSTIPVDESGPISRTMISYATMAAKPPSDCPEPLNMQFADRDHNPDYRLGCTIETYTARQIARPSDLAGKNIMDNNNGRRDANMLEGYQSGQTNPDLKGTNASQSSSGN